MKYFFFILSVTLPLLLLAQNKKISFKTGEDYKPPSDAKDLSFFGNDKDGLINVYSKDAKLTIVRFNAHTLIPAGEQTITMPKASGNFNSENVVDLNGKYYWLYSDWDRDSQKEWLGFNKIDIENGKLLPQANKIIETSRMAGEPTGSMFKVLLANKYTFNYSAGNKKMLVSYRLHPEKRNDKLNYDNIGLHVFDENMEKLWGAEFTMPYTEAIMDNSDFTVDDDGNAYMVAKVYSSDKRRETDKETGKPGYHFEILKFGKENRKIIQISLPANDNFIDNIKLLANNKNEIIITGMYAAKFKNGGYDGVFLAVLDQQNKITQFKNGYYRFPLSELVKFENPGTRKKMEREGDYPVRNLRVRNIIAESDGSTVVAMEQYDADYKPGANNTRGYWYYYYDNIFAAKIGSDGNMEWFKKIPKQQWGTSEYTLGYKLIPDAAGYCFLYMDNLKNLNLPEDE
ncbi:MAG: hypothetical protein ABUT20_58770, partial [Bacteroidota bacterium]